MSVVRERGVHAASTLKTPQIYLNSRVRGLAVAKRRQRHAPMLSDGQRAYAILQTCARLLPAFSLAINWCCVQAGPNCEPQRNVVFQCCAQANLSAKIL
jgi:hypothetical protein